MRSIILLSLSGSTLAVPFGKVFDAVFGRHEPINHHHHHPPPPIGTGTGLPFPTGTGLPFPTGTFPTGTGVSALPYGAIPTPNPPVARELKINYQLAPTTTIIISTPLVAPEQVVNPKERRQYAPGPSFSRFKPSGVPTPSFSGGFPTGTNPGFPFPTGEYPTAPTGGESPPFLPTTLKTLTKAPRPTPTGKLPDFPTEDEE